MRLLPLACGLAVALALTPLHARADDDVLSDTARDLFLKGVKAYEQHKWEQGRASLLAAWAIKRHGQIAGNLAECELKLGLFRDAAEHAWFFAHSLRPDAPTERRAGADSLLKETQAKVVTLTLSVDVDDADVLVDGKSVGKAPLAAPVFLDPGRHTIEALHVGDPGSRIVVDTSAGEARELTLKVKKVEAPPPPPPPPLPATKKEEHPPPPPPPPPRPIWPAIAAGSAAVVALGIGTGLTVAANAKGADRTAQLGQVGLTGCTPPPIASMNACTSLLSTAKAETTLSNGAIGAFATGGGLALVATGLVVWATKKPAPRDGVQLQVAPTLGITERGMVVRGTW